MDQPRVDVDSIIRVKVIIGIDLHILSSVSSTFEDLNKQSVISTLIQVMNLLTSIWNLIAMLSTIENKVKLMPIPMTRSNIILTKYQTHPLPSWVNSSSWMARMRFSRCANAAVSSCFQISRQKTFHVRCSPGRNFFAERE